MEASLGTVGPLRLQIALVKDTVMLGEPVILRYGLTCADNREYFVYMGRDRKDWLAMGLVSEVGAAAPRPDPRFHQGGIHSVGASVSARGPLGGYQVVSQELILAQPGGYSLTLEVRLPYISRSRIGHFQSNPWYQEVDTVLTAQISLPLTVMEPEPERLRAVAEALWRAREEASSTERQMLIGALFSMPEQYASETWRAAAADPRLLRDRPFMADQLERVNTTTAADILMDMVENAKRERPPVAEAGDTEGQDTHTILTLTFRPGDNLGNMYFHTSPEVKDHIAKLYTDRSFAIPVKPVIISD